MALILLESESGGHACSPDLPSIWSSGLGGTGGTAEFKASEHNRLSCFPSDI